MLSCASGATCAPSAGLIETLLPRAHGESTTLMHYSFGITSKSQIIHRGLHSLHFRKIFLKTQSSPTIHPPIPGNWGTNAYITVTIHYYFVI